MFVMIIFVQIAGFLEQQSEILKAEIQSTLPFRSVGCLKTNNKLVAALCHNGTPRSQDSVVSYRCLRKMDDALCLQNVLDEAALVEDLILHVTS